MKAAISDAPIGRAEDRRRPWRLAAVSASLVVHAGILAAALAGLTGRSPPTDPEPLSVELVVEQAAGEGAAGDGSPSGGAPAGSDSGPMRAAADVGAPADVPAPPAAVPPAPTRPPPRRPRLQAAKAPPPAAARRLRQQAAREPRRQSAAASDASDGAGETIVASLGATAGAASTGIGRGDGGRSGLSGGGASRGPGFAPGSAANPMPPYPSAARRRGIEGTVVLQVLVSADGRALSVEIARSSGSEALDEAARTAIGRWRFRPATRGGDAIAATASVPVRFSLVER